ncbi:hypothetical protein D3C71_1603090 [compost metagenome]
MYVLDNQVRFQVRHMLKDFLKYVPSQYNFGGDRNPIAANQLGFILQPLPVLLLTDLAKLLIPAHQPQDVDIFDKHRDMQYCASGFGKCDCAL